MIIYGQKEITIQSRSVANYCPSTLVPSDVDWPGFKKVTSGPSRIYCVIWTIKQFHILVYQVVLGPILIIDARRKGDNR